LFTELFQVNLICKYFIFCHSEPLPKARLWRGAKNLFKLGGEILRFAQDDTQLRKLAHSIINLQDKSKSRLAHRAPGEIFPGWAFSF